MSFNNEKIIFEKNSLSGGTGYIPDMDNSNVSISPNFSRKSSLNLPEISESETVRHFTRLSTLNFGVDSNFYPLGSCTMKYNPKVCEKITADENFANLHPFQAEDTVQGILEIMYNAQKDLSQICGMDSFTLMPSAGAHGEFTALKMIDAYFKSKNIKKTKIIMPDSAHGTNPASASVAGFDTVTIKSNDSGKIDLNALSAALDNDVAALMITNPNTLGVFETEITEIARIVHEAGALLYCDGANMNAILGVCRPGDMGFDVMHLNLHKTFATPHGGGGPGSGAVGVKDFLIPFLPSAQVVKNDDNVFSFLKSGISIGNIRSFYGNIDVVVKAYAYTRSLGFEGLRKAGLGALLNANYLRENLKAYFDIPDSRDNCMHEFVISLKEEAELHNIHATDCAKYLLDHDIHAPTIYFPLIVEEAIMIEPTETESKETLDNFIAVMKSFADKINTDPDSLRQAPVNTPFKRFDEVLAARKPNLCWQKD